MKKTLQKARRERIAGRRVFLGPIDPVRSARRVAAWKNDPELAKDILSHLRPTSLVQAKNWIRRSSADPRQALFGIYFKSSRLPIGVARLMSIDRRQGTADLGLYIGERRWRGRGLGRETVLLLCECAFLRLGLRKMTLRVAGGNRNAIRCYASCGFETEGLQRKQCLAGGRYVDVLLMGLFAEKWKKNNSGGVR